jgi:voltage-gated potassium channel
MKRLRELNLTDAKSRWHRIIFGIDTVEGKRFDIWLLVAILLSVFIVILTSVPSYYATHGPLLRGLEWVFTAIFTLEYIVRVYLSTNKRRYIFSFWGIIDLVSTLPAYLSLFIAGPEYVVLLRILRLLRVFRIFRLNTYSSQALALGRALRASGVKITVFFSFILMTVIIMGATMFLIEGKLNPAFSSIPKGIYWAIVTITTVGYGDITPQTVTGQFLSSALMLIGYAIITVPTGIVSVEYAQQVKNENNKHCPHCDSLTTDKEAKFCSNCGESLDE